jgi:hypothetical protein
MACHKNSDERELDVTFHGSTMMSHFPCCYRRQQRGFKREKRASEEGRKWQTANTANCDIEAALFILENDEIMTPFYMPLLHEMFMFIN